MQKNFIFLSCNVYICVFIWYPQCNWGLIMLLDAFFFYGHACKFFYFYFLWSPPLDSCCYKVPDPATIKRWRNSKGKFMQWISDLKFKLIGVVLILWPVEVLTKCISVSFVTLFSQLRKGRTNAQGLLLIILVKLELFVHVQSGICNHYTIILFNCIFLT